MPEVTDLEPVARCTIVDGAIVIVAILAAAALWVVGDRTAASVTRASSRLPGCDPGAAT